MTQTSPQPPVTRASFTLSPTPPYDFELTAGFATYFTGRYGADIFENGTFRRLLDLGSILVLAAVSSTGTLTSPCLEVDIAGPHMDKDVLAEAQRHVAWTLGVDGDLAPFYHLAQTDPHLAHVVSAMRGLHIPLTTSVYEALVLAILGQQISSHVARVVRALLIETYGPSMESDGQTYRAFPRPEDLAAAGVEGLRSIKFSRPKAEYIVDIATRVAAGELDLDIADRPADEVVETLAGIRGAGPWTAQWLLVRALGLSDGFPYGDLALQRHMGLLVNHGNPMPAQDALEYSRRWSPYRSYATTYLFAAARASRLEAIIRGIPTE